MASDPRGVGSPAVAAASALAASAGYAAGWRCALSGQPPRLTHGRGRDGDAAAVAGGAAADSAVGWARALRARALEPLVQHEEVLQAVIDSELLLKPYWPPVHGLSGMVSSGLAGARSAPLPPWLLCSTEVRVVLQDGGTVSLDWWSPPDATSRVPVALVLPGLGTSSRSLYIRTMLARLQQAGFAPVALNYRGVGHLELTSPRMGLADSWRDLPEVLAAVRAARPGVPVVAVGWSLGSVILARHLGERGSESGIAAAVAISGPLKYQVHGKKLAEQRALSFLMASWQKVWLLQKVQQFRKHLPSVSISKALRQGTLHGLLETICSVSNGFSSTEEYFRINDPTPLLNRVACPFLVLNALDDPLVGPDLTPYEEIRGNRRIVLAETRYGGHMGWGGASRGPLFRTSWADSVSAEFLSSALLGRGGGGVRSPRAPPEGRLAAAAAGAPARQALSRL